MTDCITLFSVVEQHILSATHNCHGQPTCLRRAQSARQQSVLYSHVALNHGTNFVDPNEPDIDTENIDCLWMLTMRKLKEQMKTCQQYFPFYVNDQGVCVAPSTPEEYIQASLAIA